MAGEEDHHPDRGRSRRDHLCARPAAELPREQAREQDDPAGRQGRWKPQDGQGVRRDLAHRAGDQRGKRTLVGVAPGQVLAGGEEVELVSVVPVAGRECDQDDRHRRGEHHRGRTDSRRSWHGVRASRSSVCSSAAGRPRRAGSRSAADVEHDGTLSAGSGRSQPVTARRGIGRLLSRGGHLGMELRERGVFGSALPSGDADAGSAARA
jgi:hypothetical protein